MREPKTEQISAALRAVIQQGRLAVSSRLPSWRDLASHLGAARGTVRMAYERLIDKQLILSSGAAGTPAGGIALASDAFAGNPGMSGVFMMGVPAQDAFPAKAWARLMTRAVHGAAGAQQVYPDPRGELALRTEIAAYLSPVHGLARIPAWMEDPGYPSRSKR